MSMCVYHRLHAARVGVCVYVCVGECVSINNDKSFTGLYIEVKGLVVRE